MRLYAVLLLCTVPLLGADVRTDFDPNANFSQYRTFTFVGFENMNPNGAVRDPLVLPALQDLVAKQLSEKGLAQLPLSENPDLAVRLWGGSKEKQQVTNMGPYGPYWGGPWGPYYNNLVVNNYREGTLIVDLIDTTRRQLVWRAYIVQDLPDSTDKLLKSADKDLTKAFKSFPPSPKEIEKKAKTREQLGID